MKYLHTMVRGDRIWRSRSTSTARSSGLVGLRRVERARPAALHAGVPRRARPTATRRSELTYNWDPETLRGRAQLRPPRLSRSTTSTRPASGCCDAGRHDQPPAARRRTWRSSAHPTGSRSSCSRTGAPLPKAEPWASMPNTGAWYSRRAGGGAGGSRHPRRVTSSRPAWALPAWAGCNVDLRARSRVPVPRDRGCARCAPPRAAPAAPVAQSLCVRRHRPADHRRDLSCSSSAEAADSLQDLLCSDSPL